MSSAKIKKVHKRRSTQQRCPSPCSRVPVKTHLPPRKAIPSFWNADSQNTIFMHLGENPYPPTNHVLNAITQAARHANRYPDTNCNTLREKIADYVGSGIQPKNIIVGNGSDELIDLAVTTFLSSGKGLATFEPSFFVYAFAARRHGFPVISFQRNSDFLLPDLSIWREQCKQEDLDKIALTFIANPNNPTGTISLRDTLIEYIENLPCIVVVDECYFEFYGESLVDLIQDYQHLVIFRSLSKSFGLSGLRLGYAVAHENLIDAMSRHALTFPVNVIAQAAGLAVLEDRSVYFKRIEELKNQRDFLQAELEKMGFEVVHSHTNFLLAIAPKLPAEMNLSKKLAENGVFVSDQTAAVNRGNQAIRIGVGLPDENSKLLNILRKSVLEHNHTK